MAQQRYQSVGEVADQFGIKPQTISNLFWLRHLDADRCPIVAGRRLIPESYVSTIGRILVERGYLPAPAGVVE